MKAKKRVAWFLRKLGFLGPIQLYRKSILGKHAWFRSYRTGRVEDHDGNPLPFFNYSAIDFLSSRICSELSVFEYGSGYGTFWWAARVKNVIAVEHDRSWYERISRNVPKNVEIIYMDCPENDNYVKSACLTGETFDIIVIDGRNRVACALASIGALKPDGVIVWDDMHRDTYSKGEDYLHECGFRSIRFSGIGPAEAQDHSTTIFYKSENCLGI